MSDPHEIGQYLMEMADEMAKLARTHRFELASTLFEMAHLSLKEDLKTSDDSVAKSA